MDYKELKEYLDMVIDVEKNLDLIRVISIKINDKINILGIKHDIPIPAKGNIYDSKK